MPARSAGNISTKSIAIATEPRRRAEPQAGQHDVIESIGVELEELDALAESERIEHPRHRTFATVAEVVRADVELVLLAPTKDTRVATGHVVPVEHQHLLAGTGEKRRGHEPAHPGTDDDDVVPTTTRRRIGGHRR